MDGVQLCQGYRATTVYILPLSPQEFWYSFDQPWKDERLSQVWSHPVVLILGPLK